MSARFETVSYKPYVKPELNYGSVLGGKGPKPRKAKTENPRVLRDFSNSLLPYKAFLFLKLFFPRTNYNSNYIVLSDYY